MIVSAVKRAAVPENAFDFWLPQAGLNLPQITNNPAELFATQAVSADEWSRDFVPLFKRIEDKSTSLRWRFGLLIALIPLLIFGSAGVALLARGNTGPFPGPPPGGIILLVFSIPFGITLGCIFSRCCVDRRLPGFVAQELQAFTAQQPAYAARGIRFEVYTERVTLLYATSAGRLQPFQATVYSLRITCPRPLRLPMSWATHGTLPLVVQLRFEAAATRALNPAAGAAADEAAACAPPDARGGKIWTALGLLDVPPDCVPSSTNGFVLTAPADFISPLPLPVLPASADFASIGVGAAAPGLAVFAAGGAAAMPMPMMVAPAAGALDVPAALPYPYPQVNGSGGATGIMMTMTPGVDGGAAGIMMSAMMTPSPSAPPQLAAPYAQNAKPAEAGGDPEDASAASAAVAAAGGPGPDPEPEPAVAYRQSMAL